MTGPASNRAAESGGFPVALYARTSAAGLGPETVEQILAGLTAYAAVRGWDVVLECADQTPFPEGAEKASTASSRPSEQSPSKPSSCAP